MFITKVKDDKSLRVSKANIRNPKARTIIKEGVEILLKETRRDGEKINERKRTQVKKTKKSVERKDKKAMWDRKNIINLDKKKPTKRQIKVLKERIKEAMWDGRK